MRPETETNHNTKNKFINLDINIILQLQPANNAVIEQLKVA